MWYFYTIDEGSELDNTYPRLIPLYWLMEGISEEDTGVSFIIGIVRIGRMCVTRS